MGTDVFMEAEGIVLSHNDGATGYVRNPMMPLRQEDLHEFDFLKESPQILQDIQNEMCSFHSRADYSRGQKEPGDEILDELRRFKFHYSELIDFLILGCELQMKGKTPKIWVF